MGGAQLNTFYSLRYQKSVNEVELVAGSDGPLVSACKDAGIPVCVIPIANRIFDPGADVRALIALVSHFRKTRPDLVHTHSSKAGALGRVAARIAGVPTVVHTFHGPSFDTGQPRFVYSTLRLVERICAPLADQLIAVSETTANEFSVARVGRSGDVRTVVSGIDFSRFPTARPFSRREQVRAELGVGAGDFVVLSVAHLMKDKGHEVLVDAAAILTQREPSLKFVIVGAGPLEAALRERIRQAGLQGVVALAGARDDVPDILAAADVFVQTSYREGLSRSLVEALYSELPVIASDVGGTRDVVEDGKTGMLVSAGSPAQLAARIGELVHDPGLRYRLASSGRAAVGETRSVEAMGRALDAVYEELAGKKKRAREWRFRPRLIEDATPGRPRVVQVIDSLAAGGAEGHVVRMAVGLTARGWDVSVFCLSRRGALIEALEAAGVRVAGGPPFGPGFPVRLPQATLALYRYLRTEQPDLVAAYLNASNVVGSLAARLAGVEHVVTSRRYFHAYSGTKLVLYRLAMSVANVCSDRVIAVSQAVAKQAIAEGLSASKAEVIHNSVAVPREIGHLKGGFPGRPVVGAVGRLHPDKGYGFLLDSLPAVLADLPSAHLVIVGDGRERSALERHAEVLGIAGSVSFLGERKDVPTVLRQFDVFVLPSLREGMPNSLLEAMAAQLPVVATKVGGIPEIVRDGENGVLVAAADVSALSEAVVRLGRDPALRRRLGRAARLSIESTFGDSEFETTQTEAVYLRLLHPNASWHAGIEAAANGEALANRAGEELRVVSGKS